MPRARPHGVVFALDETVQTQILSAVATACRVESVIVDPVVPLRSRQIARIGADWCAVWIVEVERLHRECLPADSFVSGLAAAQRGAKVLLSSSQRPVLSPLESQWARQSGARGLLPSLAAERFAGRIEPELLEAFPMLATPRVRAAAVGLVRVLQGGSLTRPKSLLRAHQLLARLEHAGWTLPALASWARSPEGFNVQSRHRRLTRYPDVFVGTDAVDRLARVLDVDRALATQVGELLRQAGAFRHISGERWFDDGEHFYRFAPYRDGGATIDLPALVARACSRGGFDRANRSYLGTVYPDSFIGRQATTWLQDRHCLSEDQALAIGQALHDLRLIEHVTAAHDFLSGHYFYRWRGFARSPARHLSRAAIT